MKLISPSKKGKKSRSTSTKTQRKVKTLTLSTFFDKKVFSTISVWKTKNRKRKNKKSTKRNRLGSMKTGSEILEIQQQLKSKR